MNFKTAGFTILFTFFLAAAASAQDLAWSTISGGQGDDVAQRCSSGPDGSLVVSGAFRDDWTIGGLTYQSFGSNDAFLYKRLGDGSLAWSLVAQSSGSDNFVGNDVDDSGNIFVSGYGGGPIDLGGNFWNLPSGSNTAIMAMYDPSGAPVWSGAATGTGNSYAMGIAADDNGDVLVAGHFSGTVNLGGGTLTAQGVSDIFLARFDALGNHIWSQSYPGSGEDYCYGLDVGDSGSILLTGNTQFGIDFGAGAASVNGSLDVYLAKLDASGALLWSKTLGGIGLDRGWDVTESSDEGVVLSGYTTGDVDFGGGLHVNGSGNWDGFLVKYDSAGLFQWDQAFGSATGSMCISIDSQSGGYIAGSLLLTDSIDLGGGPLPVAGSYDAGLLIFDEMGQHIFSQSFGNSGDDRGEGVAWTSDGSVFFTGLFSGNITLGATNHVGYQGLDLFDAKFSFATVGAMLRSYRTAEVDGGIEVSWELAENIAPENLRIERRSRSGQAERLDGMISVADFRRYRYLDREAGTDVDYAYRVLLADGDSESVLFESDWTARTRVMTALAAIAPNPFNPSTTIAYRTDSRGSVSLSIHDLHGRLVKTLLDGTQVSGSGEIVWHGDDERGRPMPAGTYFVRILSQTGTDQRKISLIK